MPEPAFAPAFLDRFPFRPVVIGSRPPKNPTVDDELAFEVLMSRLDERVDSFPSDALIISGGAQGADTRGQRRALHRGLACLVYWPMKYQGRWQIRVTYYAAGASFPDVLGWCDGERGKPFRTFGQAAYARNRQLVIIGTDVYPYHFRGSPGTANTIALADAHGKLRDVMVDD